MAALGGGTGIREVRDVAGSEQLCKEKKKKRFVGVLDCYQGVLVVHIPSVYVGKKKIEDYLGVGKGCSKRKGWGTS